MWKKSMQKTLNYAKLNSVKKIDFNYDFLIFFFKL